MFQKVKKIFFLSSFLVFISFILFFYFSENNINSINKFRSIFYKEIENGMKEIPLLKNDTYNSYLYSDGVEIFKKRKKSYKFWDLIK
tara:strand:+ start:1730 stop:1990 length:261 start_codon:yes stop_codon:yes gene_type:complete